MTVSSKSQCSVVSLEAVKKMINPVLRIYFKLSPEQRSPLLEATFERMDPPVAIPRPQLC